LGLLHWFLCALAGDIDGAVVVGKVIVIALGLIIGIVASPFLGLQFGASPFSASWVGCLADWGYPMCSGLTVNERCAGRLGFPGRPR
jgi:hypothetical protein